MIIVYLFKKKKKASLASLCLQIWLSWPANGPSPAQWRLHPGPEPSCSTCPVRITCLTSFSQVSTQLVGSVCNRFYRRHGAGCCSACINRRTWCTTNCEFTLPVNSNNCLIQLLLRDLGQVRWWKSSAMLRSSEKHSLWLATAHLVSSFFFFSPSLFTIAHKRSKWACHREQ